MTFYMGLHGLAEPGGLAKKAVKPVLIFWVAKVPERIQYRLCALTHRCLHGTAPPYLAETLQLTSAST